MEHLRLFALLPLFAFFYQLYRFAVTQQGIEREKACYSLGISYFTIGTLCLVFRVDILAFPGVLFLMMALLLLAKGLDRKDKKIFIDRYDDDNTP